MEAKAKESKKTVLKVKVLSVGDYLPKAREFFGNDKVWDNALALLLTENGWPGKKIELFDRKGEQKVVVEI